MGIPERDRERMIESISVLVNKYNIMMNSETKTRMIYNINSAYWCDFNDYVHIHKCKHCALSVVDENMDCVGFGTFCDSVQRLRMALR